MLSRISQALVALATVAAASTAGASPVPSDFNAFVFKNFTSSSSDAEGNLVVGGNATMSGYSVNSRASQGLGAPALVVGGNVSFNNGQINGDLYHGGSLQRSNGTVTGTVNQATSAQLSYLSTWQNYYTGLSSTLDAMANTGSVTSQWGGLWLLASTAGGTAVFDIDAAMFQGINYFNFSGLTSNQRLVLNIHGNLSLSNMDLTNSLGAYDTLLNFVDATNVSFSSASPHAEVLAPLAEITGSNGHIQGSVVASSWNSTQELHEGSTTFLTPQVAPPPSGQTVPEPSSWALAVLAIAGLALAQRRTARERVSATA